jgi:hypothetical protein
MKKAGSRLTYNVKAIVFVSYWLEKVLVFRENIDGISA